MRAHKWLICMAVVAALTLLAACGDVPTEEPTATATSTYTPTPTGKGGKEIRLLNQLGGRGSYVVVHGQYAYMGIGPRLVVFDVSDPPCPTFAGQTDVLNGNVDRFVITKDTAYVATPNELAIVDISNPTAPIRIGSYEYDYNTAEKAWDLDVSGNTIHIAHDARGVLVIDVSDPTAPQKVISYGGVGKYIPDVKLASNMPYIENITILGDDIAYVEGKGFSVVDVSNPKKPVEISFDGEVEYSDMVIAGDVAYTMDRESKEVRIIDISDPRSPTEVGTFDGAGAISDIEVMGETIYLLEDNRRLQIVDASEPSNPREVGTYELSRPAWNLEVAGSERIYAYVGWGWLGVVDVTDPADPVEVGSYNSLYEANDVAVVGSHTGQGEDPDYLYVACNDGLCIVDVSDSTDPRFVDFYSISGEVDDMKVVGDVAYVQVDVMSSYEERRRMLIFDVSDPLAPREVGSYPHSGQIRLVGQMAYLAAGYDGLHVLDVADPTNPRRVGLYETDKWVSDVAVSEDTAYVVDGNGLHIVDISDPVAPKQISLHQLPNPHAFYAVTLVEDTVYATGFREPTHIIDVSDPAVPREMEGYGLSNWGLDPVRVDDMLYVYSPGSLHILDVSDPTSPHEVGYYDLPLYCGGSVAVAGDTIYVATGDGGLWVFSAENTN